MRTGLFYLLFSDRSISNTIDSRLSRITAYLEVKIWSLPKQDNLTTGKKYCEKEEKSPLFHNIFNISLTSSVQLHIYLSAVVNQVIFFSILQIWYVEVRICRSISESPLEFEITRVNCIRDIWLFLLLLCFIGISVFNANSAVVDLGLHRLLMSLINRLYIKGRFA